MEWAERIRLTVDQEFDRVAKVFQAQVVIQTRAKQTETRTIIAILEQKRVDTLAKFTGPLFDPRMARAERSGTATHRQRSALSGYHSSADQELTRRPNLRPYARPRHRQPVRVVAEAQPPAPRTPPNEGTAPSRGRAPSGSTPPSRANGRTRRSPPGPPCRRLGSTPAL